MNKRMLLVNNFTNSVDYYFIIELMTKRSSYKTWCFYSLPLPRNKVDIGNYYKISKFK